MPAESDHARGDQLHPLDAVKLAYEINKTPSDVSWFPTESKVWCCFRTIDQLDTRAGRRHGEEYPQLRNVSLTERVGCLFQR